MVNKCSSSSATKFYLQPFLVHPGLSWMNEWLTYERHARGRVLVCLSRACSFGHPSSSSVKACPLDWWWCAAEGNKKRRTNLLDICWMTTPLVVLSTALSGHWPFASRSCVHSSGGIGTKANKCLWRQFGGYCYALVNGQLMTAGNEKGGGGGHQKPNAGSLHIGLTMGGWMAVVYGDWLR